MRVFISGALLLLLVSLGAPPLLAQSGDQQPPASVQKASINLNSATLDQLETLPGIGRKTAERIVEFRQKNGGFKKIEELMNVKGIGEKSFLKIKPLIVVTPAAGKASGQ
jgi:competence protein ComEA